MTSAAKYAEKLIILCDHATGVLARLYGLTEPAFKRPALFAKESEMDKFARLFVKKFPEVPETINKEKGADVFKQRAPEVTSALADYYCTFVEVCNFSEEAWRLLTELSASVQELRLDLNVDLLQYYFHLLTRYAAVHFLVGLVDSPQLFLAAYARAFQHTSGNTEPNFMRIAKYLGAFRPASGNPPSPLRKLQEDAVAVSLCVGNTLMGFMPLLLKYSTVSGYSSGKLFNLLQEDARNFTWSAHEKEQLLVQQVPQVRSWVLWGFLLCPAELARPGALDLLCLALKETFHLQLFRDKTLSIHKEFDELQDSYKSPNGSFKLSKHAKVLKDAYKDDEGTRRFHAELRTYLRTEMEVAVSFFTELPSCIPPKLQQIYALLSLARHEVCWFYRHQHVIPFKCSSSKVKGLNWDPQVCWLIDLLMQLTKLVESSRRDIQNYYVEFLTQHDAPKARAVCDAFLTALHNSSHLSQLVHAMLDRLHERTAGDNLESVRLNWYRLSAAVTHQQSGVPIHSTQAFAQVMNQIVNHTRHIDCIDTQLKTHGSLSLLYFHKSELFESLKEILKSVEGRAVHCVSLVYTLNSSLHNVHRLAPEEQAAIGKDAVTTADAFVRLIVNSLERCVQGTVSERHALHARTNYQAVIGRIQHLNAMAVNAAGAASLPPLMQPGAESHYEQRRLVSALAIYHKTIADICASIGASESLVVYNIEFVLREYLSEAISNLVRSALVGLVVGGPSIAKPTLMLGRVRDTLVALHAVERSLALNVGDLAREVLLYELAPSAEDVAALSAASGEAGGAPASPDPNRQMPLVMQIAQFYAQMFGQDLASLGIVFSPIRQCFISKNKTGASGSSPSHAGGGGGAAAEFERYTDVSELRALATLLGPAGVGVIDRTLLRVVTRQAKIVKDVLAANQTVLMTLSGRFTEQSVWLENIGSLQGMDQLCAATSVIGCILHFRQLLRAALQHATEHAAPFVLQAVQLAHRAVHDNGVVVDARLAPLDNLAADVGLDVGEADHPLRLAFAPYKTTVADQTLFQFLPELFGLSFVSSRWRSASFVIDIEGHTNNNHCMALAIRQLVVQCNRLLVREGTPPIEVEKRISLDLERFVRCAAFSMLHLKVLNQRDAQNPFPLPSIVVFLEQCVHACAGRVDMSLLETCYPFTMLRSTFIQVYERQTNNYSFAPVADEAGD